MSLKVLDRWSHLGPHMSSHWDKVATNVAKSHPCLPPAKKPAPSTPAASASNHSHKSSWDHWTPARMRARRSSVGPLSEKETDVDRESPDPSAAPSPAPEDGALSGIAEQEDDEDRELRVMRKAFRRWCRKAGVQAEVGGELQEGDVDCDWTRPIAPKVEGRIVMVGSGPGGS